MSQQLHWQKSSYSGENMDCVEIASDGHAVHIRESDEPSTVITTTKAKLAAWIQGAKASEFDHLTTTSGCSRAGPGATRHPHK